MKEQARKRIDEVAAAVEQLDAATVDPTGLHDWCVIDVREPHEFAAGHLPGALNLPRSSLEFMAMTNDQLEAEAATGKPALVYCGSGMRSLLAARTLGELGMARPVSMSGGFKAWCEAGKPVEGQ